jgi:hypothetical protein
VKIRVADDTLRRVLTGLAEAAARNKKLGLARSEPGVQPSAAAASSAVWPSRQR